MSIQFGTDGWRAKIADTYTFDNVRLVAHATARFWKSEKRKRLDCYSWKPGTYACTYRPAENGLLVGYDARFLSENFAAEVANVIASHGIPVHLSKTIAPTPTNSYAVKDRNLSGGIMITASHNPYQWNGFKIKMEFGGSSLPEITQGVEEELERILKENAVLPTEPKAQIQEVDLIEPYFDSIRKLVDLDIIQKQNFKLISDPMYGTNVGLLKRLLPKSDIHEIHGYRNPLFPGINPEPIDLNLKELMKTVPAEKGAVGLAFDGDGDRIGAVDEEGNFLSSHEIFCLLLWHLVKNRKWSGGVAKTFSTTNRVKLLAEHFKLPFYETPIGFKYIAQLFLTTDMMLGGEESGGIGMKNHVPERDSLLNAMMLLELMAVSGKKLGENLRDIHALIGTFYTDRIDMGLPPEQKQSLIHRLTNDVPKEFGGLHVEGVSNLDGIKYLLTNHAWILFRPSGTEPLIRIYAEAGSQQQVQTLLQQGRMLVTEEVQVILKK